MPIGSSDGNTYEDMMDYHLDRPIQDKAQAISIKPVSSDDSKGAPEAPAEPADALKSSGGTETPGNSLQQELMKKVDEIYNWKQSFNKAAGDTIVNAMKLPGDVYQGNVPAGSVQEIERAADLASLMVTGPAPVAAKMADGTLGSFMGVKSQTIDKTKLYKAQDMEMDAAHPDDIWNATGTFRGADGKWRQEIDDSKASIKVGASGDGTLGQFLDHPELYKAYPELKDFKVRVDPYHPSRSAYADSNKIVFGTEAAKDIGTVLHEVQHVIQSKEDFAKGGMPGKVGKDYQLKYEDEVNKLRPEFLKLQSQDILTKTEGERLDYLKKVFGTYSKYASASQAEARNNYMALAGEVEARNAETRSVLSPEGMRRIPPSWTEDTPRSKQIIRDQPSLTTPYPAANGDGFLSYKD